MILIFSRYASADNEKSIHGDLHSAIATAVQAGYSYRLW
jgi:hypothetical protein